MSRKTELHRTAPERVFICGVPVDRVRQEGALDRIGDLIARSEGATVFTPNVDHIVMASEDAHFRAIYRETDLSLVDGVPVLWASRLLGTPLPEKVSGSDLLLPLVARAAVEGWRVYLLGGPDGVGQLAASRLQARFPSLAIAGVSSPFIDMARPSIERRGLLEEIAQASPHIVLVALGAPKQEFFIAEARRSIPAVFMGVGASLDFIAGTVRRAPAWMSNAGLEWLYRLGQEPRRLAHRYLVRDPRFAGLLARDLWHRYRGATPRDG